jgi:SAM-dependent methyltransferase
MSAPFWDAMFDPSKGFAYGQEPNDFLKEQSAYLKPNSHILSLGEGEGRNAVYLASLGHRVHCMDLSPVGLEKCKVWAESKGLGALVTTEVADLAIVDLKGDYDVIYSIWCHTPSELTSKIHAKARQCIRKGGMFLLEAYTPDNIGRGVGGPQDPDRCVTKEQLERDFEGCEVEVVTKEREIQEGRGHNGLSAVVQLVVRM